MPTQLPRVNVVVTEEQRALLFELARLDPSVRSAASFLREMLDEVTPLLRVTVPAMRAAAEEIDTSRETLRAPLRDFMSHLAQLELPGDAPGGMRPQRSEDAPAKRKPSRSR